MSSNKLRVAFIESFYADSHKQWLDGLSKYSEHELTLFTLPGRHWKWRMKGGAIDLAEQVNNSNKEFDLFILTDMVDLPTFKSLLKPQYKSCPIGLYFHENQLAYPWSETDPDKYNGRDAHYGMMNFKSIMASDSVAFNSVYNLESLIKGVTKLYKALPDSAPFNLEDRIRKKSKVIPLGMELKKFCNTNETYSNPVVILWNHRWEFDKGPSSFHSILKDFQKVGIPFELNILGKEYSKSPGTFSQMRRDFEKEIRYFGYIESYEEYLEIVKSSDILLVTSNQDFFGISVVEAMAAGVTPILPNRLAYNEHISDRSFFYSTEKEALDLLVKFSKEGKRSTELSKSMVSRYDWDTMIKSYDRWFTTLSKTRVI